VPLNMHTFALFLSTFAGPSVYLVWKSTGSESVQSHALSALSTLSPLQPRPASQVSAPSSLVIKHSDVLVEALAWQAFEVE
jgi:hypothetical protein